MPFLQDIGLFAQHRGEEIVRDKFLEHTVGTGVAGGVGQAAGWLYSAGASLLGHEVGAGAVAGVTAAGVGATNLVGAAGIAWELTNALFNDGKEQGERAARKMTWQHLTTEQKEQVHHAGGIDNWVEQQREQYEEANQIEDPHEEVYPKQGFGQNRNYEGGFISRFPLSIGEVTSMGDLENIGLQGIGNNQSYEASPYNQFVQYLTQ